MNSSFICIPSELGLVMAKNKQWIDSKWRGNFRIIVPAFLIICFPVVTTGAKSLLNVTMMETQQSFVEPVAGTGFELHIVYPRRVSYNTEHPTILKIWMVYISRVQNYPSVLHTFFLHNSSFRFLMGKC